MSISIIKFSVNNWDHLYSLEQAILNDEYNTGKTLSITGMIRNENFLTNIDTPIHITLNQVNGTPKYKRCADGQIILGKLRHHDDKLDCSIPVSENVFNELRKNIMEYADIDGIHIIVNLGLILNQNIFPIDTELSIIKLDYAMKGDA